MTKRIVSLATALTFGACMICSNAFAVETKTTQKVTTKPVVQTAKKTVEMTLQEAIKYADEHNSTIRDLKKAYSDYFDTYSDVKKDTRTLQNKSNVTIDLDASAPSLATIIASLQSGMSSALSYATTTSHQYAILKGYSLENSQNIYDDLAKTVDNTEQSIAYNIEKLAYDILDTQEDIAYYKNMKIKMMKDLAITKLMYKLEMVNALQVSRSKNAVSQMDTTIRTMNNVLLIKNNALKALMGLDRNTEIKIKVEKPEFKAREEVNLEELQENALKTRKDALSAIHKLRGKEIDFLVYDFEKPDVTTYNNALTAFNNEKIDCENKINDIKFNIQKVYDNLLTSENTYIDALEGYRNTLENNKIDKLKYEKGMISLVELMGSNLTLEKAENDFRKALHANIMANKRFVGATTIGDFE